VSEVPSWGEFAGQLTAVLAELVEGGRLIISASQPPGVYVQAAQDDADLVVEAVADRYLPPGSGVGASGGQRLRGLGWDEPEDEYDNWTHQIAWPARTSEYQKAANMMVAALRDVYGVPGPGALAYTAWNDLQTPPEQEFPQLGIARAPR
jgi:hypothetical protein